MTIIVVSYAGRGDKRVVYYLEMVMSSSYNQ